jgi:hypothetical protein
MVTSKAAEKSAAFTILKFIGMKPIKAFRRMANPMRCAYFLDFFAVFVL